MPWWTKTLSALSALRTKTRQSYKSWSKQKSDESKAVYQAAMAEYQRVLRKSRNISFGNMRTVDPTGKNLISTLSNLSKSAPGIHGISPALIQSCFQSIRVRLLLILNACLQFDLFPISWKCAKVLIIGKICKSSYDTLSSFRPIRLGNSFAKIFEKVISGRLQWHAKRGNWVSDNQQGFMDENRLKLRSIRLLILWKLILNRNKLRLVL